MSHGKLLVVYDYWNTSIFNLFQKPAEIVTLLQMAENCLQVRTAVTGNERSQMELRQLSVGYAS